MKVFTCCTLAPCSWFDGQQHQALPCPQPSHRRWGQWAALAAAVCPLELPARDGPCCKDAATFISSYNRFVALGHSLSFLFGKPDPANSFTAASGPSSVLSGVHCRGAWFKDLVGKTEQYNVYCSAGILYCGTGHTGDFSSKCAHQTPCCFRLNTITHVNIHYVSRN